MRVALAVAREADPRARVKRMGPDGIEFDYPTDGPSTEADRAVEGWA